MNAEDVAGRRRELVLKFLWESKQSREALAFSWRSVQQMEDRQAEDWTQVSHRSDALVFSSPECIIPYVERNTEI